MKTLSLISFFATAFLFVKVEAQRNLDIYKTYDDYLKNNPIHYEGDYEYYGRIGFGNGYQNTKFLNEATGEKLTFNIKKIWGFKYGDGLYRIGKLKIPLRVVSTKKLIYYEDGESHLLYSKHNFKKDKFIIDSAPSYFSSDLGSDDYLAFQTNYNFFKISLAKFIKAHPEHKELFDCLGDVPESFWLKSDQAKIPHVRECVGAYTGEPMPTINIIYHSRNFN